MKPLSESSKKLILFLMVFIALAITIPSAILLEPYSQSYVYRHPNTWWHLQYGSSTISQYGIIEIYNDGTIKIGNVDEDIESSATWIIFFPEFKSLVNLKKNVYIIIQSSIWCKVKGSTAQLYFNDYRINIACNRVANIKGIGPVFLPDKEPDKEDGNLHYSVPPKLLKEENVIKLVLPPRSEAYINSINLKVAAYDVLFNVKLSQRIAAILLVPYLAICAYTLNKFRRYRYDVLVLVSVALVLRLFVAPYTEHIYDLEVFKRHVKLLYGSGVVDIASFAYGPLWLFTLYLSVCPVFIFGLAGDLLLNFVLKTPAIVADLIVFVLLVNMLSKRLPREKALKLATWAWLFNPLVIWLSSVHGLYVSTAAMFAVYTVYILRKSDVWSSLISCLGTAFLWTIGLIFPGLVAVSKRRIRCILVFLGVSALIIMPFFVFGSGLNSLIYGPIFSGLGRGVSLGLPGVSEFSYQFIIKELLNFSFETSLALVSSLVVGVFLFNQPRDDSHRKLISATVLVFVLFYVFYPTFYSQHIIWVIPFLIIILIYRGLDSEVVKKLVILFSLYFLALIFIWGGASTTSVIAGVAAISAPQTLIQTRSHFLIWLMPLSMVQISLFVYWVLEAIGSQSWAKPITTWSKLISVSCTPVILLGLTFTNTDAYIAPTVAILVLVVLLYATSLKESNLRFSWIYKRLTPVVDLVAATTVATTALHLKYIGAHGMAPIIYQVCTLFSISSLVFLGGRMYLRFHPDHASGS